MAKRDVQLSLEGAGLSALLSVAIDSGLSIIGAIEATFLEAGGEVASKFRRLLSSLGLGGNLYDELMKIRSNSKESALNELIVKLQIAIQFGSPLSQQLSDLSQSLRRQLAHLEITEAARRENLMLMPLVFLILPVSVVFAIYPTLQYLNLSY